jgi:hypothetical protein
VAAVGSPMMMPSFIPSFTPNQSTFMQLQKGYWWCDTGSDQIALFKDGRQIGNWFNNEKAFKVLDASGFRKESLPKDCPKPPVR